MALTGYVVSASVPLQPSKVRATRASTVGVVPWVLTLLSASAWLYAGVAGASQLLVAGLGAGVLLTLGIPLAIGSLRHPQTIAWPINVFLLACIYFFVLDMALLRRVEEFHPETVLIADTVIVTFLVTAIGTWCLAPLGRCPWTAVLRRVDGNLTGSTYFWMAVIAFSLEYMRRLYFVDWRIPDLVHDLLLPRGQGAFRRGGVAGDWRIFLQPIEVLFWGVAFFADRAWKNGISRFRKLVLVCLVALQLSTFVLDGVRGPLLIAVILPLFARAAQHDQTVGRWVRRLALASFLLAPVMDIMVGARGYGWLQLAQVERVSWNILEAHRDDNFFWTVNLVDFIRQDGGVLAYKVPWGFIEGIQEVGYLFFIMSVPRIFWPDKPLVTDMGDETRMWYATDSVAGSLLRYGGVTFIVLGGILFGLWIKLLEPLYLIQKGDGATIAYAFMLVITILSTRALVQGTLVSLFFILLLILIGWGTVHAIQHLSSRLAVRVQLPRIYM
ncbi:MAG TPA: hypothetical protein VLK82_11535 [Candidatus Tectomicrobia bacterium]|nr:hypothetical protein [Candidatus Tectomicrobia bacterium]